MLSKKENLRADIVVIGGGVAGLPAAEAGTKNIIVLEKALNPSGNAPSSGIIYAVESPTQKRWASRLQGMRFLRRKWQMLIGGLTPRLACTITNKSGEIIQWL